MRVAVLPGGGKGSPSAPLQFPDADAQRRSHLLVEHEQVFGALAFRGEAPAAVEPVHRAVESSMGTPQGWVASSQGRKGPPTSRQDRPRGRRGRLAPRALASTGLGWPSVVVYQVNIDTRMRSAEHTKVRRCHSKQPDPTPYTGTLYRHSRIPVGCPAHPREPQTRKRLRWTKHLTNAPIASGARSSG